MMIATSFIDRYMALYPSKNKERPFTSLMYELSDTQYEICGIYALLKLATKYPLSNPNYIKRRLIMGGLYLTDKKMFWLFCNTGSETPFPALDDFTEIVTQLVLEKNNEFISLEEYAMLIYISYQDEEMKKALKTLPLPMLRDTLLPIAENNKRKWSNQVFVGPVTD
jgi:hypothetical protein